jgi:hypothetical protein
VIAIVFCLFGQGSLAAMFWVLEGGRAFNTFFTWQWTDDHSSRQQTSVETSVTLSFQVLLSRPIYLCEVCHPRRIAPCTIQSTPFSSHEHYAIG